MSTSFLVLPTKTGSAPAAISRSLRLSAKTAALIAAALAVLGLGAIWPTTTALWGVWTSDPLRSIGILVPPISLALTLRAWRSIAWESNGTWWGLPLLLAAVLAGNLRTHALLLVIVSSHIARPFPSSSLIFFAYAFSLVLFLGGVRLLRAALFPVLLTFLVNPVPSLFSLTVDLPLQRASALVARAFASHLGHPLQSDQLRLMFTPQFGMFIAPGCNGVRGAVTMGLIALLAGHLYHFRRRAHIFAVVGAVALGYAFNLLRLCALVLYYVLALHVPSLQPKAEQADYLIGALLFLCATLLLLHGIHALRRKPAAQIPSPSPLPNSPGTILRLSAAAIVIACGSLAALASPHTNSGSTAVAAFPSHTGAYSLTRTWQETVAPAFVVYNWAEYTPNQRGTPIAIGLSPSLGWHDALICHSLRGESPLWQGPLILTTTDGAIVRFNAALFADATGLSLEASTECLGGTCNEYSTGPSRLRIVYADSRAHALTAADRPVPVLIIARAAQPSLPPDTARRQLSADIDRFVRTLNLTELSRPYQRP